MPRFGKRPDSTWCVRIHSPSRLLKNTISKLDSGASENPGGITGGFLEHLTAVNFPFEQGLQSIALALHPCLPLCSCRCRQRAHPHHVVHGGSTREHPAHPGDPTMPDLPQQPHGFEPPKDVLDALAFPLTHRVARMAGGAPINSARPTRGILRHMRRHPQLAQLSDTVTRVIVLICAQGDPLL